MRTRTTAVLLTALTALGGLAFSAVAVADDRADERTGDADGVTTAAAFDLRPQVRATGDIAPDIRIQGRGWGHGVGMSQIGAQAQALEGRSASEIMTFYYAGTEVATDSRASEERIRVGIDRGVTASSVRALDDTVTWQVCTPEASPPRDGRVPAGRCADWFEQAPDEQLRVRPLPLEGAATPNGTQTHTGADLTTLDDVEVAEGDDVAPAPDGGLLVQRRDSSGTWRDHRAYATPAGRSAAQLPVARAVHGGDRIAAQTYATDTGAPTDADGQRERTYAHGWRDLHLTARVSNGDVSYGLAVVQDVVDTERYLQGLQEVPTSWPAAALEAQVITGRTYALRSDIGGACRCDILASPASQVFRGTAMVDAWQGERWQAAIDATRDQVLTYDGELAQTFYSSSHGGRSENVEDSWAYYLAWQRIDDPTQTQPPSYLRSVDDPWSVSEAVGNSRRDWTATASNAELTRLVNRERDALGEPRLERIERVRIGERTDGGTPRTLRLTATTVDGERTELTYRGVLPETRSAPIQRPIAGALLRRELALTAGGEAANGRISSSQITVMGFDPFTDDDGSTHEYAITWAAEAGIVSGLTDTTFGPSRDVTRAQMATFLNNTFALPTAPGDADTFPDVAAGSTHHAAIEAIAKAGITLGYGDGTYRPSAPVSRAEMATFLTRAMLLEGGDTATFTDVAAGSTHDASIRALAASGITAGCAADRFCPEDPVSRGQLATFTYRSARR